MILKEVRIQPSDIYQLIPINTNLVIDIEDEKIIRTNSTNIIDDFSYGYYDEYEVLGFGVENYDWLKINLAKIDE